MILSQNEPKPRCGDWFWWTPDKNTPVYALLFVEDEQEELVVLFGRESLSLHEMLLKGGWWAGPIPTPPFPRE